MLEQEQKVQELRSELGDLQDKLASWKRREEAAFEQLEEAIDEGGNTAEASSLATECRYAVNRIEGKIEEKKAQLRVVQKALVQAEYEKKRAKASDLRKEADAKIEELRQELVETAQKVFAESDEVAEEYNRLAEEVGHLANQVGERYGGRITKLHSHDAESYAKQVLAEEL